MSNDMANWLARQTGRPEPQQHVPPQYPQPGYPPQYPPQGYPQQPYYQPQPQYPQQYQQPQPYYPQQQYAPQQTPVGMPIPVDERGNFNVSALDEAGITLARIAKQWRGGAGTATTRPCAKCGKEAMFTRQDEFGRSMPPAARCYFCGHMEGKYAHAGEASNWGH